MNTYINFITESGISLGLLTLVYLFFLRNETFFRLNRLYLLVSAVFSGILPLLHIPVFLNSVSSNLGLIASGPSVLEVVEVYGGAGANASGAFLSLPLIGLIYFSGILFFALRFTWKLGQMVLLVRSGEKRKFRGLTIVRLGFDTSAFSFFRWLFVGRSFQFGTEESNHILKHEMVHIRQRHSIDVLLLELVVLVQWFNPFIWYLRRAVRENHEFLADALVVNKGISPVRYKAMLIEQVTGIQLQVANNFNYSLLKSRIKMISKIKSPRWAGYKYLIGLIGMLLLVVVFACEKTTEPATEQVAVKSANVDSQPLMVLDEVPVTKAVMDTLNPKSISHIDVLKNKESLAPYAEKYGQERVKNGVILIYTKGFLNEPVESTVEKDASITRQNASDNNAGYNGEPVFFIVENMPKFPGGDLALRKYIAANIKYPEDAQKQGIQGKVYVTFVVTKTGEVGGAKIARGVSSSLDDEALRVVRGLPKWTPGTQRGKAVNVQYTVPINFVLQ
jgi:TonB family protein